MIVTGFLKIMPSPKAGGRPARGKSRPPAKRSSKTKASHQAAKPARQPTQRFTVSLSAPSDRAPSSRPAAGGRLWLYGRHAVEAALNNPRRTCHVLLATDEALTRLNPAARAKAPDIQRVQRPDLDDKLGEHIVHQGIALAVAPLPTLSLKKAVGAGTPYGVDLAPAAGKDTGQSQASGAATAATAGAPAGVDLVPAAGKDTEPSQPDGATVLVLDRINDPHNLGAILRSAVAFGARAVIVPARQSAELSGAVAKAASGALDMIPIVEVTNLARTLDTLKDLGYWRAALDGQAAQTLDEAPKFEKLALVLGAEGAGIRRLVAEHCDLTVRLPISSAMESLNVSVACGIALYALANKR